MNGTELLDHFLEIGYIVRLSEDDFVITNKFKREVEELEKPETQVIELETPETLLKRFVADCRIPFRAKGPHGNMYQLNAISVYAKKFFYKVMMDKEYEYKDMVSATSAYYNNQRMSRVTLTNYFQNGVFEGVMLEFLNNKKAVHSVHDESGKANTDGRVSL